MGKFLLCDRKKEENLPLDVNGLSLDIDRNEIVDFIIAGRRKVEKSSG